MIGKAQAVSWLCLGLGMLPPLQAAGPGNHWSFQPVRPEAPPPVADTDWPRGDVDRFILARLEAADLAPLAEADDETLIRRLYFNLIGLPPSPEQLEHHRGQPIATIVDALLASPRFGEKWARHWLDLARYAETNGRDRNVVLSHAWRYRDWVIEALNRDLPYDRFVREQIAGDLETEASDSQIVATGFLTLGPKAFQEVSREKFMMDLVDEQIDVMSRSLLGLTIACARCHDHKFDPIPQKDYYSLAGILLSSETLHGPGPLYFQNHQHNMPVVPIGPDRDRLDPGVQEWRGLIYEKTVKAMKLRSAGYKIRRLVTGSLRERGLEKPDDDPELLAKHRESEAMYAEAEQLLEERDALWAQVPPKPAYAMAMREAEKPEDCRIRVRGVFDDRGELAPRGQLSLPGFPALAEVETGESGRRQLAAWLTAPENPLTARVFVNRVWHQLFGRGLVRTVDNFGVTGEAPSHPELLDFLADRFMHEDGWSVKKLIRRIVTSRTWALESAGATKAHIRIDPANTLLWRANLRRLDVESFRDAVLTVGGQLACQPPAGGSLLAEVFLGKEYGKASANRVNFDEAIADFRHRTVYLPIVRNEVPELLKLFDFTDPNAVTGARNARTIPSQALYLMNSPFIEAQSEAAARRLIATRPAGDAGAIDRAFLWISATTTPSESARQSIESYLDVRRSELIEAGTTADAAEMEAWTDVFQTLFSGPEFRFLR